MRRNFYILFFVFIVLSSCLEKEVSFKEAKRKSVAMFNGKHIIELKHLDSIIANQIYDMRLQILNIESSKYILNYEARKQNIPLSELIEKEVNNKSKGVTDDEVLKYKSKISSVEIDDENIRIYLTSQKRMDRKEYYVDSLRDIYNYKIKLAPPYFTTIKTSKLNSFNLNMNKSKNKVFIISDFDCFSCQKAESELEKIISLYTKDINFEFVYFSDYINPKIYQMCLIADKNNKFSLVHDILFENVDMLNNPLLIDDLPKYIKTEYKQLDSNRREAYMKNAIMTKDFLLKNEIYSTPTFIVNNKIIDGKNAIDYLEDIIISEFKINENQ